MSSKLVASLAIITIKLGAIPYVLMSIWNYVAYEFNFPTFGFLPFFLIEFIRVLKGIMKAIRECWLKDD